MTPQEQEIDKRRDEIKESVVELFEKNMKIFDWDIPENDDKVSAHMIYEAMSQSMEQLKDEINKGKYDQY